VSEANKAILRLFKFVGCSLSSSAAPITRFAGVLQCLFKVHLSNVDPNELHDGFAKLTSFVDPDDI
jgi:hypothetical protein